MEQNYHIGTPGSKWGEKEKKQWLGEQKVKRSYKEHVLNELEYLKNDFEIINYGLLKYEGFNEYPLYALKNKDFSTTKRTILVTGGVHGYETSGVKGALKFAKKKASTYFNKYNIIIVPCVSPWGFETINRWNPLTIDVNRSFKNDGESPEAKYLMNFIEEYKNSILAHFDLHETTNSDMTEFRPALKAKEGIDLFSGDIPDGFYILGSKYHFNENFEKAIIRSVEQVTHIVPLDKDGKLIGENALSQGIANIDTHEVQGVCFALTKVPYAITTEVYPDSPNTNEEECNNAQVAAVVGGINWLIENQL